MGKHRDLAHPAVDFVFKPSGSLVAEPNAPTQAECTAA
jgi:hypothetical protein